MPDTPLPPLAGLVRDGTPVPGIASADFKGAVTLVNVWASWCVPCHDEAPLLMKLADDKRIRIVGINYKDQPENARRFIGRYGNPFAAVGADTSGRAAIDWGVYGVPETFVIGKRRPHRLQARRSDQRRQSGHDAEAAAREGAGRLRLVERVDHKQVIATHKCIAAAHHISQTARDGYRERSNS